jgi:hypothetical protein
MNTAAFRLGYMSKIAEFKKMAQSMYAPGIKNTLGVKREDPEYTRRRDEAAAADLDSTAENELDEEDRYFDDFKDWGDDSLTAWRDELSRRSEREAATDEKMQSTLASMSPEARQAYLNRKAKNSEGADTEFTAFNSNRARRAVLNNQNRAAAAAGKVSNTGSSDQTVADAFKGVDAARENERKQRMAQESAERASRFAGNSTVKWTPRGTSTVQPGTGTTIAGTTKATPQAVAANQVASGRLRVKYNPTTGSYSRADGANTPWTDAEKKTLTAYHASKGRTAPIAWAPTTVQQGFNQSFGKGSGGLDVQVATPTRKTTVVAANTPATAPATNTPAMAPARRPRRI